MRAIPMFITDGTEDGPPVPIEWAAMHIRDADGTLRKDWATDNDPLADPPEETVLVLVSGAGGEVRIGPWDVDLDPGTYFFDFEVLYAADGATETLFAGDFPVLSEAAV